MGLCGSSEAEAKPSATKKTSPKTPDKKSVPIVANTGTDVNAEVKSTGKPTATEAYVQSVKSGTEFVVKIGIDEQKVKIRGVIGHSTVNAEARRELSSIIVAKNVQLMIHETKKGVWIADVTIGRKDVVGELVKLGLLTCEEDCGVKKWQEYEATAKSQQLGVFQVDKPKKKGHRRSKSKSKRKASTGGHKRSTSKGK